jgi:hypothetical protein
MAIFRTAMLILGVLAALMGLLWIGQGTGLVHWPASSFMIAQKEWAFRGAALVAVGAVLIFLNRSGRGGR